MNDIEKQIEEMARTLGGCYATANCKICDERSGSTSCYNKTGAKNLYNADYRKLLENEVVVSKAEYNDLKGLEKHFDDYLIKEIKETRKETAEKIFALAVEYYDGSNIHENFLSVLKEQFGVGEEK